jgi:hypothetical protein
VLFQGASDALLHGILGDVQFHADRAKIAAVEEPQDDRFAIALVKSRNGFIQCRSKLRPVRVFGLIEGVQFDSGLFASTPPAFGAQKLASAEGRMPMEPRWKHNICRKRPRFAGEVAKDQLSNVRGEVSVPINHPEGGGIDYIDVPLNDFRKRRFGTFPRKSLQEITIIDGYHSPIRSRRSGKSDKKSFSNRRTPAQLLHGRKDFVDAEDGEIGGVIGHGVRNNQVAAMDKRPARVDDIRHVAFTFVFGRLE